MKYQDYNIAIIGLGYVGLPLAVEFGKKFKVVGFDINITRINELKSGLDKTLEVDHEDLKSVLCENGDNSGVVFTSDHKDLNSANVYIITVPTPVDKNNNPVLAPLEKASKTVGEVLSKGDVVVYESTVYPGVTEDVCVPILEQSSGLKFNQDFYCGYSPERINPGDKEHTLTKIRKVVSGSTPEIGEKIKELYGSVISAGTYLASSIRVAEAAKVIENSQRDINIAFVNELAKIFNKLGIDTYDVLEAASTKWNFLSFKPGLVGGHCIGVDPYYLAQKAQEVGYHPEIILAGRRVNDGMGDYIGTEVLKLMVKNNMGVKGSNALILGITFKENCPDIRNTKVIDVYNTLTSFGIKVEIFDPWADVDEVYHEYKIKIQNELPHNRFDVLIHAVSHKSFNEIDFNTIKKNNSIVYDIKGTLDINKINKRL